MGFDYSIVKDIEWTSISCNILGILAALYKLRQVMSSKINKTFTKTKKGGQNRRPTRHLLRELTSTR